MLHFQGFATQRFLENDNDKLSAHLSRVPPSSSPRSVPPSHSYDRTSQALHQMLVQQLYPRANENHLKMLAFFLGTRCRKLSSWSFLTNSPPDFATSAATINLAVTAASLCDLAFVNMACFDTRLLFNSSNFWSVWFMSRCSYLSWCPISKCPLTLSSFIRATLSLHRRHTALSLHQWIYTLPSTRLKIKPLFSKSTFRLAIFWGEG